MKWEKFGKIFDHDSLGLEWFKTNVMVPVPYIKRDGNIRLFLTFCDKEVVGRAAYVDLDSNDPTKVLGYSKNPILDIGAPGMFDDFGVLPASIVAADNKLYMFYSGYQRLQSLPYVVFSGIAVSEDEGESFRRISQAPFLDRRDNELFIRSNPVVRKFADGYRIYYASGNSWSVNQKKEVPVYDLKTSNSRDLLSWTDESTIAIPLENDEYGITVPSIWEEDGRYKMIYSIRSVSSEYRLGYAESVDGVHFTRMDHLVGIDVSTSGWDSEMICFANRVVVNDNTWLFYVGNNYGRGGLGVAKLTSSK